MAYAGRLTPAPCRRPKLHGSGARHRAPLWLHWRRRRAWSERRRMRRLSPRAVDTNGQVHRGSRRASLQTPRAGRRETGKACGDFCLCAFTQSHTGLRGFSGPGVPRALVFGEGKTCAKNSGAENAPRERFCAFPRGCRRHRRRELDEEKTTSVPCHRAASATVLTRLKLADRQVPGRRRGRRANVPAFRRPPEGPGPCRAARALLPCDSRSARRVRR